MLHHKLSGIILKIDPFHEYDKLVTFFSYESGLIRIFAKGVRRARSHRSYFLDLFNHVVIDVEVSGPVNSGRMYLREVTMIEPFRTLKKDLDRFGAACIISSFITRMIPMYSLEQAELYELTLHTLFILNTPLCTPRSVVSTYILKASKSLGHLPTKVAKNRIKGMLNEYLDPQFTLQARRTLGIFSKLERMRSS